MAFLQRKRTKPPITLHAGFLPDMGRKEARDWVIAYIDKHFGASEQITYRVWQRPDGCHWELQEGGRGRAFMPAVEKALAQGAPGDAVAAALSERTVEFVRRDDGYVDAWILPESTSSQASYIDPSRTRLKGFSRAGQPVMIACLTLFFCAACALAVSVGMYYSRPKQDVVAAEVPALEKMPVLRKEMLENVPEGSYVSKMEYKGREWRREIRRVELGPNDAGS